MTKPKVIVIGGSNGSGKSTIARRLLHELMQIETFVNADVIASGLAAYQPETVAIEAARIMLERLHKLAAARADFAFETTLAARSYARWIQNLLDDGYSFHLHFVSLRSADLAVQRVRDRVALGGHNIPEQDIRRRYIRASRNFFEIYQSLADYWFVYDNSTGGEPNCIASGGRQSETNVLEWELWQELQERGNVKEQ